MVCQVLTIGAVGWAPAGLVFHRLPPHSPEQRRPQKAFPRPSCVIPGYYYFPATHPPVPAHILATPTWRQQLEGKRYPNNKI